MVAGALECSNRFANPLPVSAVDHEGAYRSLPVRDQVLVLPGDPPALRSHFAFLLGSVGSVARSGATFRYFRVGDVASSVSRCS